ncbi:hypothetical protein JTB14_024995 [Gonioctena quinquepunctata]|nr:hypothetical protein JTB14_024995 [Gonioctena quinquepunctata]
MDSVDDVDCHREANQDDNSQKTTRPPPVVMRDKKVWPKTIELLTNIRVIRENSHNIRDDMKMHLRSMHIYDKTVEVLEQHRVAFHTYNKMGMEEIPAIFKGVPEDLEPADIVKELKRRRCDPRVVARFKNCEGEPLPIILIIRRNTRLGRCYNCQKFGHGAANFRANPVCAGNHESWQHNKEDESPNKCGDCDWSHRANYRGCLNFPSSEKNEKKKEQNKQARPRPRIPPRERGVSNPKIQENAPLVELLSVLDKLGDLMLILAGLI